MSGRRAGGKKAASEMTLNLQTLCLVILELERETDMNKGVRFTDEFKQDAMAQVVERGYAVSDSH